MPDFNQESQKLDPSAIISLFTLDTSSLGGPVLRFTKSSQADNVVTYQGVDYTPIDVDFTGLETTGVGAFPTPKISIANTDGVIEAIVNTYGDLNGCSLSRLRTYKRFLDDQPDADPNAYYGPDNYRVERKDTDTPEVIGWELSTAIDQEGKQIPGRVIITNTCSWRYRVWDEDAQDFVYTKAQCPYAGAQSYDINNQPVNDGADDVPSRTLKCCKVRFGEDQPLPFGGFPGVPRY